MSEDHGENGILHAARIAAALSTITVEEAVENIRAYMRSLPSAYDLLPNPPTEEPDPLPGEPGT